MGHAGQNRQEHRCRKHEQQAVQRRDKATTRMRSRRNRLKRFFTGASSQRDVHPRDGAIAMVSDNDIEHAAMVSRSRFRIKE
jgi:hypothetical protein